MKRETTFCSGFTLVEVVLALGIVVFGIVIIMGLLSVLLQTHRESENQMRAADTASNLIAIRRVSPTNTLAAAADTFLPTLNQNWDSTKGAGYISEDGKATATASSAAFYATYQVGTNAGTGGRGANVDVVLSWPAAASANAQNHYEIFTAISW